MRAQTPGQYIDFSCRTMFSVVRLFHIKLTSETLSFGFYPAITTSVAGPPCSPWVRWAVGDGTGA